MQAKVKYYKYKDTLFNSTILFKDEPGKRMKQYNTRFDTKIWSQSCLVGKKDVKLFSGLKEITEEEAKKIIFAQRL